MFSKKTHQLASYRLNCPSSHYCPRSLFTHCTQRTPSQFKQQHTEDSRDSHQFDQYRAIEDMSVAQSAEFHTAVEESRKLKAKPSDTELLEVIPVLVCMTGSNV